MSAREAGSKNIVGPIPARNYFCPEWFVGLPKQGMSKMNQDSFEGAVRSGEGKGEQFMGQASKDGSLSRRGNLDEAAGKAQSALGSAKDALASGVDAAQSIDFTGLRDEIASLSKQVADLVQKQAIAKRDQLSGAVAAATDSVTQSASSAQDKLNSLESDVEDRIKKNPWGAVAAAALAGFVIGKIS
jgi:ElaB/YqjD/DUF883 family membrane-anchored ribosome-binding protein